MERHAPNAIACGLCGGTPVRALFEKQDIPYHACPNCGFVFSRPAKNANFETLIEDYEPAYLDYLEGPPRTISTTPRCCAGPRASAPWT